MKGEAASADMGEKMNVLVSYMLLKVDVFMRYLVKCAVSTDEMLLMEIEYFE